MKVIPFIKSKIDETVTIINVSPIDNAVCIYTEENILHIYFIKNGDLHNSKFQAEHFINKTSINLKYHYLYGQKHYNLSNNKFWKKQAKKLIRQNNLKIFL